MARDGFSSLPLVILPVLTCMVPLLSMLRSNVSSERGAGPKTRTPASL